MRDVYLSNASHGFIIFLKAVDLLMICGSILTLSADTKSKYFEKFPIYRKHVGGFNYAKLCLMKS